MTSGHSGHHPRSSSAKRLTFSEVQRAKIRRMAGLPDADAREFVWHLENVLNEVKKPARAPAASKSNLVKTLAPALKRAATQLLNLSQHEARHLVLSAEAHLKSEAAKWQSTASTDVYERRAHWLEQPIDPKNRLAKFGREGLRPAYEIPRDFRAHVHSLSTLAALASDLELLCAAASEVQQVPRPTKMTPQALIAEKVLDIFAMHALDPGGRQGLGAKIVRAMLIICKLPAGSPGSLIETGKARKKQ